VIAVHTLTQSTLHVLTYADGYNRSRHPDDYHQTYKLVISYLVALDDLVN